MILRAKLADICTSGLIYFINLGLQEYKVNGSHPRRNKWSEAEERILIDKYGEMVSNGCLAKMKTREKKFRPIALFVNTMHNVRDPSAFPWQWSWKDVSTKVQNMRHQYLLVKQKIKRPEIAVGSGLVGDCGDEGEFEWEDGDSYWSNFLRYKEVFGDVPLINTNTDCSLMGAMNNDENGGSGGFSGSSRGMDMVDFGNSGDGDFGAGIDGGENGVLGLDFEYDVEEGEENYHNVASNHMREDGDEGYVYEEVEGNGSEVKKRKRVVKGFEKKAWNFLVNQLSHLKGMEKGIERREVERGLERQRRESLLLEREKEREKMWEERDKERAKREMIMAEVRKRRISEWTAMEKEQEERERRRREELSIQKREGEERMNIRRPECKKRIDGMLDQHRAEMGRIQTRILHEQQNLTNQLLTIVSQWSGHPNGLAYHTGTSSHYLSPMMQSLHHVNSIVHDETRVEGDNQDQFIVD